MVQQHGRPTHQVALPCHLVTDGVGAAILAADLATRDPVTGEGAPVSGMQPLEQARWQGSPAGRRQNRQALRYWEQLLRAIPARRFRGAEPCRPRYRQAMLHSPALYRFRSRLADVVAPVSQPGLCAVEGTASADGLIRTIRL